MIGQRTLCPFCKKALLPCSQAPHRSREVLARREGKKKKRKDKLKYQQADLVGWKSDLDSAGL
jgi:hypothetical protein